MGQEDLLKRDHQVATGFQDRAMIGGLSTNFAGAKANGFCKNIDLRFAVMREI